MRSLHRPSARLTAGRVDMAPWLPQCCTVRPIHAPARPAPRGRSRPRRSNTCLLPGPHTAGQRFNIGMQGCTVHLRKAQHEQCEQLRTLPHTSCKHEPDLQA
jgi:hypothetical protein